MNVLLIEDEELDVIALQRALSKAGMPCDLTVARNGADAIEILRQFETNQTNALSRLVLILDINMPLMNGIEFLGWLRRSEELKKLPVFVLTTSDEQRDICEAYRLGISGYLLKQNVGRDYEKLIKLLNAFDAVVNFPFD